MLQMVLDENISPVVSEQVTIRRPEIAIQSIFHWRGGRLVHRPDHLVLQAAQEDGLTLVTYDVTTIKPLTEQWDTAGISYAGVIFIHQRTIPSDNFGMIIRALEQFWDRERHEVWTNRIHFLQRP